MRARVAIVLVGCHSSPCLLLAACIRKSKSWRIICGATFRFKRQEKGALLLSLSGARLNFLVITCKEFMTFFISAFSITSTRHLRAKTIQLEGGTFWKHSDKVKAEEQSYGHLLIESLVGSEYGFSFSQKRKNKELSQIILHKNIFEVFYLLRHCRIVC